MVDFVNETSLKKKNNENMRLKLNIYKYIFGWKMYITQSNKY